MQLTSQTIGILGGGQLGRMLAVAASQLGIRTHIFAPEADSPAFDVAHAHTCAAYADEPALLDFAKSVDVVTIEFENVPASTLQFLARHVPVHPSAEAVSICQHRVREKEFIASLGIGTAPFARVDSQGSLDAALAAIGTPAILKTCTMGYDGKGQWKLDDRNQMTDDGFLSSVLRPPTSDLILEGFVDFILEMSVVVARSSTGQVMPYVPVHNIHKNHILHQTIAPAPVHAGLLREAEAMACAIVEGLGLIGILAVEMFVTRDGKLLVNELAPRPHNSGHWTLDACLVSQFEQTVRAVCGLPLGDPAPFADAVMTNLIGDDVHDIARYLNAPRTRVHLYGKKEAKPGRKMGHVVELLPRK